MAGARKLRTSLPDAGRPLALWLAERLELPLDRARALVERGGVYVDGARVRDPDLPLRPSQRVVAHDAPAGAPEAAAPPPDAPGARATPSWRIVHKDEDVIVIDKPAGLPSQAERAAAGALDEQVAARHPGARLLHRLDRDTSGLVLFTRRRTARGPLQEALAAGRIARRYTAVVDGHPAADELVIDASIGPDPADRRRSRAGVSGGRPARSEVRVLRRGHASDGAPVALVEVRLVTGRTHQIRAHLASVGHPILGDPLYAPDAARRRAARLALHAHHLAWPGGAATIPVPADLLDLVLA